MSEIFQRKKAAVPLSAPKAKQETEQQTVIDSTETLASIDKALGLVTITHGASEMSFPLAGKTVAYVRETIGPLLHVPEDADVRLNNEEVGENALISANATIEFIRASGTKG